MIDPQQEHTHDPRQNPMKRSLEDAETHRRQRQEEPPLLSQEDATEDAGGDLQARRRERQKERRHQLRKANRQAGLSQHALPLLVLALLLEGEEARAVPGARRYFITNRGRIISTVRGKKPRVLNPWRATNGYLQVDLVPDEREPGSQRIWKPTVHKVVKLTFDGPPPVDPAAPYAVYDVCHNDGDKENNALVNLRYDLKDENGRDNLRHGQRKGKRPGTGFTPVAVWKLRCRAQFEPHPALFAEFAESYGVGKAAVRVAYRGKPAWGWVPFPQDAPTVAELAQKLGVSEEEAAKLLALAHPDSGREAA